MKNVLTTLKNILADIAKFKDAKVAASFVALLGDLLAPLFGIHIGPVATVITAALVLAGVVVSYVESKTPHGTK